MTQLLIDDLSPGDRVVFGQKLERLFRLQATPEKMTIEDEKFSRVVSNMIRANMAAADALDKAKGMPDAWRKIGAVQRACNQMIYRDYVTQGTWEKFGIPMSMDFLKG